MINENFQETLKSYRKARGLTQDDLGDILSVSGQTIYKYESGVTFPPANMLEKILTYFEIDPNTLFQYQSAADNDMEEIRNLLENHKRVHSILYFMKVAKKEDMLKTTLKEQDIEVPENMSEDTIMGMHRYLLMRKIDEIIDRMEETAHKTTNPHTGSKI